MHDERTTNSRIKEYKQMHVRENLSSIKFLNIDQFLVLYSIKEWYNPHTHKTMKNPTQISINLEYLPLVKKYKNRQPKEKEYSEKNKPHFLFFKTATLPITIPTGMSDSIMSTS